MSCSLLLACFLVVYLFVLWLLDCLSGLGGWEFFHFHCLLAGVLCTCTFMYTGRGVLCQLSSVGGTCPGGHITFSCVASGTDATFTWTVTSAEGDDTACVTLPSGTLQTPTCGPMGRFTVSVNEDRSNSTLSVQSVDDILNGTRVECTADGDVDEEICVIG